MEREHWIDAVRSLACLMVITVHAPIPGSGSGLGFISVFNYYSMVGVPLFFMISGALVLYKEQPLVPFLKKRLSRIVLPAVIWIAVSIVVDNLTLHRGDRILSDLLMIPFSPYTIYWFIYVLLGIYLIARPLQVWLARSSEGELRFYLLLWGITLLVPYLELVDHRFASLIRYNGGCLYYAYGYLGYALLGYYLRRYVTIGTLTWRHVLCFLLVAVLPWCLYLARVIPHDVIQDRLTLNAALLAACYFIAVKSATLTPRLKSLCAGFASHSFGIYLIHLLIMRGMLWPVISPLNMHYALQIPLTVALTALISYIAVGLLSRLPGSKYFIGL